MRCVWVVFIFVAVVVVMMVVVAIVLILPEVGVLRLVVVPLLVLTTCQSCVAVGGGRW